MEKREFIKKSVLLLSGAFVLPAMSSKSRSTDMGEPRLVPFALPKLNYAYDALEPSIDTKTMEIHHTKHHAAYIAKLNESMKGTPFEKLSLNSILSTIKTSDNLVIRNNAGGHFNHSFFWETMRPNGEKLLDSSLLTAINKSFGSYESFKLQFSDQAKSLFGSGWTWLCIDKKKKLFITTTPNQDNPLMDKISKRPGTPLLALDVWEHAYYLKYQNKRVDYISNFFDVIDWKKIEERFQAAN